jgi:hypothetical protein
MDPIKYFTFSMIISISAFIAVYYPFLRESYWVRKVCSAYVEKYMTYIRVGQSLLGTYLNCCRGCPENPVPRGFLSRLLFYFIQFVNVVRVYLTIEESSLLNTCKSNVKGLLKMGRVNRHPANQSKPFRFESQTIRSS